MPPQLPVPLPTCRCRGSLPTRQLLRRCPGSSTGRPRCPRSDCLSLARDKPVAEQLVGFPQPWTSWDYLFLSEQPLAPATPHQHHNQPRSFSFMPDCCHQKEKKEERQSQDRFPPLLFGVIPPPWPELGSVGARRRVPAQKAPAASLWHCPALSSPEHPTFEHEASFVSESSPKGVGLPPLF